MFVTSFTDRGAISVKATILWMRILRTKPQIKALIEKVTKFQHERHAKTDRAIGKPIKSLPRIAFGNSRIDSLEAYHCFVYHIDTDAMIDGISRSMASSSIGSRAQLHRKRTVS